MPERVKRISGKVNRYLSDLVTGVPCYTTLGAPFLCISGVSLLDSPFDLISGIQSFKLAFSEQHYSTYQVSLCRQILLLVGPAVLSMKPYFGLTFLSEVHRAHLSFCSRNSCGSDLQLCSLRNQSRGIDWVSMEVEGPLWTAWPFYSDSMILKSVIVAN